MSNFFFHPQLVFHKNTHSFNICSKLKDFLPAQRVYNFVLCTVIPRNYTLGGFDTSQTTQDELYFPTKATWFQRIYFGQEKSYTRKQEHIYKIYEMRNK